MSKKDRFVILVQTAAIVASLVQEREKGDWRGSSSDAMLAVNVAMEVNEAALPDDLASACELLITYIFENPRNSIPKPEWLIGIL